MWSTKFLVIIIVLVSALFLIWQLLMNKAPEPKYQILQTAGEIEIRRYSSLLIAQVATSGDRSTAINAGFRILADYIFGNNKQKEKLAMTAPVRQQGVSIPMVAPVTQKHQGDAWLVEFVMPDNFTKATLPMPVNQSVSILEIPAKEFVVIQFSGSSSDSNLNDHELKLRDYIKKNNLKVVEPAIYAFYNPPWILPMFRRTEIMLEIHGSSK